MSDPLDLELKDSDKFCPLCTWRGPVELDNGICPQCGVDWPKSYQEYRDALTVARDRIAAQKRQLEEAQEYFGSLLIYITTDKTPSVDWFDLVANIRAWLAANSAPQEQTK